MHPKSAGYGRALKTGIAAASHDLIAITDADGTYPIEELPTLIELAERFAMVVGARTGEHFRRVRWSPTQATFLLLTNFVTGSWLPDPNSGFRVFRRADVLPLLDRLPNGFSFTTTLSLVLTLNGAFVHFHLSRLPRTHRVFEGALRSRCAAGGAGNARSGPAVPIR